MSKRTRSKNKKLILNISIITLLVCICLVVWYCIESYLGIDKYTNSDDEVLDTEITSEQVTTESTEDGVLIEYENSFDITHVVPYSGKPYMEINNNIPFFTREERKITNAFESYSELDELGRCRVAYANVCQELMPTEERGEIGPIKPSGWHTVKYNDLIDGNYLYNRCHLIGFQLTGENANEKNLITGTRYLNVVGMLEFENMVSSYVKETNNHVLYRVTPIFEGDNLVASGVLIEAWSVEDNGAGICINVYCYNVQPGIIIDYLTGDSQRNPDVVISTEDATENLQITEVMVVPECDYVVNTNSKKIHLPSCASVEYMAEHNKWYYIGDIDSLLEDGYKPCQRCLAD